MLEEHYWHLWKGLAPEQVGQPVEVTLKQVSDILFCTSRNANLILKQMVARDWLVWTPGRGRGNRSNLRFLTDPETTLLMSCDQLLKKGKVQEAFERLQDAHVSDTSHAQWARMLTEQFGHHSEHLDGQQVDVLRFPFSRPLVSIDPFFVSIRTENQLLRQMMESLVRWNEEHKTWEGLLAHTWDVDDAGREYVFHLRKGLRFHHGKELTALDVKATFDRLLDPKVGSYYRELFDCIQEVECAGRYAVRFRLHKKFPLFVNLLGLTCASIQPHDRLQDEDRDMRLPIGTGPFQVVQNDKEKFVMEVFPSYFFGRPFLDRVEMWVVPDLQQLSHLTELGGQEITYYSDGPRETRPQHMQQVEKVEQGCFFSMWNFNIPGPQHDIRFRQAFSLIIDPERMVRELKGIRLRPAYGLLERESHKAPPSSLTAEQRVKAAKQLLSECEYQGEELLAMTFDTNTNRENLTWMAARAAEVGIRLRLDVRDRNSYMQPERLYEAHLISNSWITIEDEEVSLYDQFKCNSITFRDPLGPDLQAEVDRKLDALMELTDPNERKQHYIDMEQWLEREAVVKFLYHSNQTIYYHPQLRDANLSFQGHVDFRKLWWEE